jgi:hypothetical protein
VYPHVNGLGIPNEKNFLGEKKTKDEEAGKPFNTLHIKMELRYKNKTGRLERPRHISSIFKLFFYSMIKRSVQLKTLAKTKKKVCYYLPVFAPAAFSLVPPFFH